MGEMLALLSPMSKLKPCILLPIIEAGHGLRRFEDAGPKNYFRNSRQTTASAAAGWPFHGISVWKLK